MQRAAAVLFFINILARFFIYPLDVALIKFRQLCAYSAYDERLSP